MSKFQSIISDSFENGNSLTKVRIKIDPAKWTPDCDVTELEEYSGYILQEFDDGTVDVFIPGIGSKESIFNIPMGDVDGSEAEVGGDRYEQLKELILSCMQNKGVNDEKIVEGIRSADCVHVLEDWMRHASFSERDIIEVLKEYISESR